MTSRRWMALMTIDAHPADVELLQSELPVGTLVFLGESCAGPRTGIAMIVSALTLTNAQAKALRMLIDSLPNLGHTEVTSLQVFTVEQACVDVAPGGFATFTDLLYGPRVTAAANSAVGLLATLAVGD